MLFYCIIIALPFANKKIPFFLYQTRTDPLNQQHLSGDFPYSIHKKPRVNIWRFPFKSAFSYSYFPKYFCVKLPEFLPEVSGFSPVKFTCILNPQNFPKESKGNLWALEFSLKIRNLSLLTLPLLSRISADSPEKCICIYPLKIIKISSKYQRRISWGFPVEYLPKFPRKFHVDSRFTYNPNFSVDSPPSSIHHPWRSLRIPRDFARREMFDTPG